MYIEKESRMVELDEQVWMHDHKQARRRPASAESVRSKTEKWFLLFRKKYEIFFDIFSRYLQGYILEVLTVLYTVQPVHLQVQ